MDSSLLITSLLSAFKIVATFTHQYNTAFDKTGLAQDHETLTEVPEAARIDKDELVLTKEGNGVEKITTSDFRDDHTKQLIITLETSINWHFKRSNAST
jgi:hypothetical protein